MGNRHRPQQVNFRCSDEEKEAYDALSELIEAPLSEIIRSSLRKEIKKLLGTDWYDYVCQKDES